MISLSRVDTNYFKKEIESEQWVQLDHLWIRPTLR